MKEFPILLDLKSKKFIKKATQIAYSRQLCIFQGFAKVILH